MTCKNQQCLCPSVSLQLQTGTHPGGVSRCLCSLIGRGVVAEMANRGDVLLKLIAWLYLPSQAVFIYLLTPEMRIHSIPCSRYVAGG